MERVFGGGLKREGMYGSYSLTPKAKSRIYGFNANEKSILNFSRVPTTLDKTNNLESSPEGSTLSDSDLHLQLSLFLSVSLWTQVCSLSVSNVPHFFPSEL